MKKRNNFNMSYENLLTCDMGQLVPVGMTEVLPGDSALHMTGAMIRFSPMVAPVFATVYCHLWHFYVPYRLIWEGFEDFITGGRDGMNTDRPPYTKSVGKVPAGSLEDYFGLPLTLPVGSETSAFPIRAYNLIYNEFFRDEDLEEEVPVPLTSGLDTVSPWVVRSAAWERDYFTTARPWPQKGPQVTIPVSAGGTPTATVSGNPVVTLSSDPNVSWQGGLPNTTWTYTGRDQPPNAGLSATATAGSLKVDVSAIGLGSIDVSDVRQAMAMQRFEEHRAMYGSRFTEYLRYLGVKSSDARLQRPEYLGGSREPVQFSEVLQTSPTEGAPVGTMAGHGVSVQRSRRYRRYFEEHGLIMSLMCVRPRAVYQQGLDRFWSKRIKEDYWQKELEHIGQQQVMAQEVYAGADPDKVFGYQNRYDEYRENRSQVHGEFRNILNYWHLAREFGNEPVLNADFIKCSPSKRIFAAQQNHTVYAKVVHNLVLKRIMAKYGNPI